MNSDDAEHYQALMDVLVDEYDLGNPRDLILLDIVVKDFLRVQRIHRVLSEDGDFNDYVLKNGDTIHKAHEAGYLLNAVETQLRNNLKELGLTKKEHDKKTIGKMANEDFTDYLDAGITKEDKK